MTNLRNAAFTAALFVSGAALQPAHAMPVASLPIWDADAVKADFMFGDGLAPGRPSRLDRIDVQAAQAAVESYFSFDAFITLGALALAGAAMAGFAAVAARRVAEETRMSAAEPAWRDSVFRAVQADLIEFAESQRRAA